MSVHAIWKGKIPSQEFFLTPSRDVMGAAFLKRYRASKIRESRPVYRTPCGACAPSISRRPVESKSSVARLIAPAGIHRGQAAPTEKYRVSAAGRKFSRKQTPMNANAFKKSRQEWPHLSACYRVCVWRQQYLRSWVFGVRVREGFVCRAGRALTSAEYYLAHSRSFAAKPNDGHNSSYGRLSLCLQVSPFQSVTRLNMAVRPCTARIP